MKNRGVSFNDRELAGQVRTLALSEVMKVLKEGEGKLYEAVLIRLAGTILPRLNEITGENGSPVIIELSGVTAKKYGLNTGAK